MIRIVFIIFIVALSACSSTLQEDQTAVAENNELVNKARDTPIFYDGKAPYRNEAAVKPEIISECPSLNKTLSDSIEKYARGNGLPLIIDTDDNPNKRTLSVEIINASPGVFVFGNFGSVPAELSVEFKVFEGEELALEKYRKCATNLAGFMGMQPSACNKLEKCAINQGKYIAKYITRSLYAN